MTNGKYAQVSWTIGDIQSLRPDWTREQAQEWLESNEKYIMDEMISTGWTIIESLLPNEVQN